MSVAWHEVKCSSWDEVRNVVENADVFTWHVFWHEPWHPDGAVVRLEPRASVFPPELPGVPWDDGPDRRLFSPRWGDVADFFNATSQLAAYGDGSQRTLFKLTHCHLNAHGLDVDDEALFALRFACNRIRVAWRYDRRRLIRKWLGR